MLNIISVEKFKGSTYQVNFDDGEPAFINSEIIAQYNIKGGMSVSESAWNQVVYANEFRRARERALYLMDYRDHSYIELFKKLEKNYDEDICYDVIDSLVEVGIVDDRRYAENLAQRLMEVKRCGYYKAVQEMRQKGISKELAAEILAEYEDTTQERLKDLIESKYARRLEDEDGIKKVKNALIRNGYSYKDINAALEDYLSEEEY
ncbi:MAG: recombination regulator RecX [Ruminococcus sp.]|nr:recombination regulator RecX [Ruminococcus sp.]